MKPWGMALLALLAMGGEVETSLAGEKTPGLVPGERLTFLIRWMAIPAGRAEMKVTASGPDQFALSSLLESTGMVKVVYPLHDELSSRVQRRPNTLLALEYTKIQQEGRKSRRLDFRFDRAAGVAWKQQNGSTPPERVELNDRQANDPITTFYAVRYHPGLRPGARFEVPIIDNDKQYAAVVKVGESQQLFTGMGWFQALPVNPTLESSDLFRHEGGMVIWLTDDHRRLPLRVTTSLRLSSAAADLVSFEDGLGGRGEMQGSEKP